MLGDLAQRIEEVVRVGVDTGEWVIPIGVATERGVQTDTREMHLLDKAGVVYRAGPSLVLSPRLRARVEAVRRMQTRAVLEALREMREVGLMVEGAMLGTYLLSCFGPDWLSPHLGMQILQDAVGRILYDDGRKFKVTKSLLLKLDEVLH